MTKNLQIDVTIMRIYFNFNPFLLFNLIFAMNHSTDLMEPVKIVLKAFKIKITIKAFKPIWFKYW